MENLTVKIVLGTLTLLFLSACGGGSVLNDCSFLKAVTLVDGYVDVPEKEENLEFRSENIAGSDVGCFSFDFQPTSTEISIRYVMRGRDEKVRKSGSFAMLLNGTTLISTNDAHSVHIERDLVPGEMKIRAGLSPNQHEFDYFVAANHFTSRDYNDFLFVTVFVLDGTDAPFDPDNIVMTTVEEVLKNPSDFDGISVEIQGHLRIATELQSLIPSDKPRYLHVRHPNVSPPLWESSCMRKDISIRGVVDNNSFVPTVTPHGRISERTTGATCYDAGGAG